MEIRCNEKKKDYYIYINFLLYEPNEPNSQNKK